jgi:hypothetical protein
MQIENQRIPCLNTNYGVAWSSLTLTLTLSSQYSTLTRYMSLLSVFRREEEKMPTYLST